MISSAVRDESNGSSAAFPIFKTSQLDYASLITHLSSPPHFPISHAFRNQLVAHYETADRHEQDAVADADPWQTLLDSFPRCTICAAGDVPLEVRSDRAKEEDHSDASSAPGVWGIIFTYFRPTFQSLSTHIWISTEAALYETNQDTFEARPSAMRPQVVRDSAPLVKFLLLDLQREAVEKLQALRGDQGRRVTLGAVEQEWANLLCSWLGQVDVETLALRAANKTQDNAEAIRSVPEPASRISPTFASGWNISWANPCASVHLPVKPDAELLAAGQGAEEGEGGKVIQRGRWSVRSLISDKETKLVQKSNKLPFSLDYVESRKHLSIIIRDALEDANPSDDLTGVNLESYPTDRRKGNAAGWVYAHDQLSLGSLHVTSPYRRLRSADASLAESESSVGRLLVHAMGLKLHRAIMHALARSGALQRLEEKAHVKNAKGPYDDFAPTVGDTELTAGALGFFERCGFKHFRNPVWLGLEMSAEGAPP
ncbi:hypothetical protein IE81DRAFT_347656 [Ceraceosorus guamensis]|uniref:FR47-like domain-containing protein n=1 Tax=Ceraceosorus guamensis TaxID=1522189 RepID=A0A316VX69_9BASI|nr:hypothetical protein IE81DRAFT_347656 [Ceraceosorus guamensis]PWN42247.1 hypothetical protein IE81DRAFT_347656 [Ceraceosorus guamensis]